MDDCQAVLGMKTKIQTMYGDFAVQLNEGIQPGDKIVIKEFGARVPKKQREKKEQTGDPVDEFGTHYIHFNLRIPTALSAEERKLFEKLAVYEGDQINQALPEDQVESKNQEHDLSLKDSREYRSFLKEMEGWKHSEEIDVTITADNDRIVNPRSLNQAIKNKLSSKTS